MKNKEQQIYYYDLFGSREYKYEKLLNNKINTLDFIKITNTEPAYYFIPKDFSNEDKYEEGFKINELFILGTNGIKTHNDSELISFSKFKTRTNKKITYRPFDNRYIDYDLKKVVRHRFKIIKHMLNNNIGFISKKGFPDERSVPAFVANTLIDTRTWTRAGMQGAESIFPIYLYTGKKRRPNFNPKVINEIEQKLNLSFVPEKGDSLTLTNEGFRDGSFAPCQLVENSFTPLDLLDYIYAVLHSPTYRETYREFLKIDFPRIPYPADNKIFWKLVALGGELRRLYLLEGPKFEKIDADSAATGKVLVEKVKYSEEKVFVNDDFCFEDVPLTAWEFYIGGYQPAQKWLKDRKGCILKLDDLKHYRKIVLALTETARIMGEIDAADDTRSFRLRSTSDQFAH